MSELEKVASALVETRRILTLQNIDSGDLGLTHAGLDKRPLETITVL